MFPSRNSQVESSQPWWSHPDGTLPNPFLAPKIPRKKREKFFIPIILTTTLVAGALGSLGGIKLYESSNFSNVRFVSVKNSVERPPNSVAGIAARVLPSVVSISVLTEVGRESGSGFIIRSNGFIITNNHVIADAITAKGKITVTLNNGQSFTSTVIGRDIAYDLAVLKIDAINLPALQLGDSDDVEVGDNVIAIGSPLGLSGTVTLGIISAKNRAVKAGSGTGDSSFINALQTDAAINPGNSGGPLVNSSGAVIGINSAIATLGFTQAGQAGSIGLGFAIPMNQAKKTAEQLISFGRASYPIVGISLDSRFTGKGALIAQTDNAILAGGPAATSGLAAGDVIIAIDGVTINRADELIVAIRSHDVGDKVVLTYQRNNITKKTTITLGKSK